MESNVPADKNGDLIFVNKKYVRYKDTSVSIHPKDIGVPLYWLYIPQSLRGKIKSGNLGAIDIEEMGIKELFEKSGNPSTVNYWLRRNSNQIKTILDEIKDKEEFDDLWKKLKILKFPNGSILSFKDYEQSRKEGYLIVALNSDYQAVKTLTSKFHILDMSNYLDFLIELGFFVKSQNFIEWLNALNDNIKKSLTPEDKGEILRAILILASQPKNVYSIAPVKKNLEDLKLFKNKQGDIVELSQLLPHRNWPGFDKWEMDASEWQAVRQAVMNITPYTDITQYMLKPGDIPEVKVASGDYKDKDEVFYNDALKNKKLYDAVKDLLGDDNVPTWNFVNWYSNRTGFKMESRELSDFMDEEVSNSGSLDRSSLNDLIEFIAEIKDHNFFGWYAFYKDANSNTYKLVNGKQLYIDAPSEVIEWAKSKGYYILTPQDITTSKIEQIETITTGKDAWKKLIEEFPWDEVNIRFDSPNIDIDTNTDVRVFIALLSKAIQFSEIDKLKEIRVNGKPIREYSVKVFENERFNELDIGNVLPDDDFDMKSFSKSFEKKYDIDIERIFDAKNPISDKEIYGRIENSLKTNMDTLIFILFSDLSSDKKRRLFEQFVRNLFGEDIEGTYVAFPLDESLRGVFQYDIREKLKPDEKHVRIFEELYKLRGFDGEIPLIVEPYVKVGFTANGELFHPPVRAGYEKKFFQYLFDRKIIDREVNLFVCHRMGGCSDKCSLRDKNPDSLSSYVYPDELATSNERIPDYLRIDYKSDVELEEFLYNLGVRVSSKDDKIAFRKELHEYEIK